MRALRFFVSWLPLLLHCAPLVLGRAIPLNNTTTSVAPKPDEIFTKNRITTDYNDCIAIEAVLIELTLSSIGEMLGVALKRLEVLKEFIVQEPIKPNDTTSEAISTWMTFRALFGNPYYGPRSTANRRGFRNVKEVEEYITNMHSAFMDPNRPKLEIWCDDDFYKEQDENGKQLPPGVYFDSRPVTDGGSVIMAHDPEVFCSSRKVLAYVVDPTMLKKPYGKRVTLMVLCKWVLNRWQGSWLSDTVKNLRDKDLEGVHLDHIAQHNAITTILHELGHCNSLVYPKAPLDDFTETVNGRTKQVTTFVPSVNFARHSRKNARNSAEHYAYFILAMYLNKWDWKSGYAKDLPSTSITEPDFVFV